MGEVKGPELSLLLRLAARQAQCNSVQCSAEQCSAGKQDPSDNLSLPLLTTAAAKPCPLSDNPIISLSLTQAEITVYTSALGMIIYMAHNNREGLIRLFELPLQAPVALCFFLLIFLPPAVAVVAAPHERGSVTSAKTHVATRPSGLARCCSGR